MQNPSNINKLYKYSSSVPYYIICIVFINLNLLYGFAYSESALITNCSLIRTCRLPLMLMNCVITVMFGRPNESSFLGMRVLKKRERKKESTSKNNTNSRFHFLVRNTISATLFGDWTVMEPMGASS